MSQKKDIIVIGSGIIGLCTAWYLNKRGLSVAVIEKSPGLEGCSHGNAGHICQSHTIPLANPGVFKQSVFWLLNSKSPFYIRPRMDSQLISWGRKFIRSSFDENSAKRSFLLARLGKNSLMNYHEMFREMGFTEFNSNGILTVCNSEEGLEEEIKGAKTNAELGIGSSIFSESQVKDQEPNLDLICKGGVLYQDDISVDPSRMIQKIYDHLRESGVEFHFGHEIKGLNRSDGKISSLKTGDRVFEAEQYLLANGAWAPQIWNSLGSKIYMQPAKGYSLETESDKEINSASLIFAEKKVVITPMANRLRVAGTLELSGFDGKVRKNRVRGILEGLRSFAPGLYSKDLENHEIWYGYRPTSPDGLPYIGKHPKFDNLHINAGHAMLGLALAAGSGELSSKIILGEDHDERAMELISPDRF